ncbi:MAG: hypothetical protein GWN58_19510 [Anaerolineae bacterium]|nr:hypothetical protein [Anaerolineae bacterium]
MARTSSGGNSGGIGFVGLLTIVFIVLKLTGVIDWAWVWVLAPLWIGLGISVIVIAVILVIVFLAERIG